MLYHRTLVPYPTAPPHLALQTTEHRIPAMPREPSKCEDGNPVLAVFRRVICFDAQLRRQVKSLPGKRGKGTSIVQACQLVELGSRVSQDTCIRRADLKG